MTDHDTSWKKTFFLVWTGQAFSIIGSSAAQFALLWWLTLQTGSPLVLAMAGIAGFLPQALLGPIAGVWIDRLSRKTVMIAADFFIAGVSAILAVAFLAGTPEAWLIYLILFLRAIGSVFHAPAMQAAMPLLVPPSELVRTGGWGQFLSSGSLMLGPVLGTLLMTRFSVPAVLAIDILGAAIAALTLVAVKLPDPESDPNATPHLLRELREGLGEVLGNRALMAVTLPVLLTTLFYVPVSSLFPLMVNSHFGGSAWHASAVEFLFAGGMLVSSLILGVWGGLKNPFTMIALSLGVLGLALTGSGLLAPSGILAFAGLSFVMGMTGSFFGVPFFAFIQGAVPPERLGRVISLLTSLMSFAIPVGLFVAAPIAERTGIAAWFSISGVLIVLSAGLGYVMTRDLPPPTPAPQPNAQTETTPRTTSG